MIIEPTPTNPRSPIRRALRLGGLVLPLVLLAVVAGAGMMGPRSGTGSPSSSAAVPDIAGAAPSTSAPPGVDPASAAAAGPAVPSQFGDLAVRTAAAALADPAPHRPAVAVAVSGFLRLDGVGDAACPAAS